MARLWLPDKRRQTFGAKKEESDPNAGRERVFMGLPENCPQAIILPEEEASQESAPTAPAYDAGELTAINKLKISP